MTTISHKTNLIGSEAEAEERWRRMGCRGIRATGYRCPLASLQPSRPDTEQIKREGWQDQGILVVSLDDERLGMIDREFVKQIGNRLYGKGRR